MRSMSSVLNNIPAKKTVRDFLLSASRVRKGNGPYSATMLSPYVEMKQKEIDKLGGNWQHADESGKLVSGNGTGERYQMSGYSMLPESPNLQSGDPKTGLHRDIANGIEDPSNVTEALESYSQLERMNAIMGAQGKKLMITSDLSTPEKTIYEDYCYTSQKDPFHSTPMILLVRTLQSEKLMNLLSDAMNCPGFNLEDLKLELQDKDGRTVLHYSYALGQEELVKQLLEINAKLPKDKQITRIFDNDGYAPKDLLLELNEAAVRKTLINLEMHPDRSIHAKRNNVFSGDDDSTLNTGENKFLLLSNKLFLEEFVGCHDYFSVSSDAKNIIGSFLNKCNKMPENSRGKTIGQECWKNVQSLQRDQEQPPKFQTTIQSNKGKNWQSTVTRSFHSSASKVPTLGVIRNSNKSLGLLS